MTLSVAACQNIENPGSTPIPAQSIASHVNGTGTIQSIDRVSRQQGLGLGTLAGAAIGGVIGHQMSGGTGKTVTTVAGAAGGAYVGHEIEKQSRSRDQMYRVTIQMDDGSIQSFAQEAAPTVRTGDRVVIHQGVLSPM